MERGLLNKSYLNKGDKQIEANKGSNDNYRSRNIIKDTYNISKEAETTSSRSEVGPKYLTDKGSPIPTEKYPELPDSIRPILEEEVVQKMLKDKGKQISGYDTSYNCHSYVFTDGKAGWINSDTVEKIIKDNGFKRIASANYDNSDYTYTQLPKEENIVIYRDKRNDSVHSGIIVKYSNNPENVIIKSKMGYFGIFEHPLTISYFHRGLEGNTLGNLSYRSPARQSHYRNFQGIT